MGKLQEMLEKEQERRRASQTNIENLLQDKGFAKAGGVWECRLRVDDACTVWLCFRNDNRILYINRLYRDGRECTYKWVQAPEHIMENDDAEAFMEWMEGAAGPWLQP